VQQGPKPAADQTLVGGSVILPRRSALQAGFALHRGGCTAAHGRHREGGDGGGGDRASAGAWGGRFLLQGIVRSLLVVKVVEVGQTWCFGLQGESGAGSGWADQGPSVQLCARKIRS